MKHFILAAAIAVSAPTAQAQEAPPATDVRVHRLVDEVSARRIEGDIRALVGFGTRHTMSDTLSEDRGIGAARRWIHSRFDSISAACGGCLDVRYVSERRDLTGGDTLFANVVNVLAIQWGTTDPQRMVWMSGDIDSRVSNRYNFTDSAPGANDNASGMAGTIEAARVLSRQRFNSTIVYAGLAGEEQGLHGGRTVAAMAADSGWDIAAFLNNDMIGNIEGISGVIDNTTARVFSDAIPPGTTERELALIRRTGGEVDGESRQLARYVDRMADDYISGLDIWMIYRLDRFGRGGHHTPFADQGYPAVRIMEANENYNRQHQDIRVEDGVRYGDVIDGVSFDYARKLTALNVVTLANLAWSPGPPREVMICGAVQPQARLRWVAPRDTSGLAGYRVYWRRPDSPTWDNSLWVGGGAPATASIARRDEETGERRIELESFLSHDFERLIIDNYLFGIAAVSRSGNESKVVFPDPGFGSSCRWQ